MASIVKYDSVYLYSRPSSLACNSIRKYLTDNNIEFTELLYQPDYVEAAIAPINTWFYDEHKAPVIFTNLPILTYEAVYWVSEDLTLRYDIRGFVTEISNLPADFAEKVVKTIS